MDTCPECGNSDMRVRLVDGVPVHECGLCAARFGDGRAVEALALAEEASERGFDARVWPLVRALEALPGLTVVGASAGDPARSTMPHVELCATNGDALVQLENLAKWLLLAASGLHCSWGLQVTYVRHLSFVLAPHLAVPPEPSAVVEAQRDLPVLRARLERDVKLTWWRHVDSTPNG